MSIRVTPEDLAAAAEDYGSAAYILTVGDDGRSRITHSSVVVTDGRIRARLGRTASADAEARPEVSVLWPATRDQSMSLIADGTAELNGDPAAETEVVIVVSGAVRHRPTPPLDS